MHRLYVMLLVVFTITGCNEPVDGNLPPNQNIETQDTVRIALTILDNEGNETLIHHADSLIQFVYLVENLSHDSLLYFHYPGHPELSLSVYMWRVPENYPDSILIDIIGGCYPEPPAIQGFMPSQTWWECEYFLTNPDPGRYRLQFCCGSTFGLSQIDATIVDDFAEDSIIEIIE